jgi:TolB-like protein/Flp pilus assembly protein TadD
MALNPLNTDALGILGLQIVHTGEFDRGTAIVRRAMELNANHAGWMHFAPLWDHFHKGEYEQALECANRVDVPGHFWPFLVMASACGHLGRRAEAKAAVRDLLAIDPEFATHARSYVGTWHFASGLMDPILEGLRKAGLSIPEDEASDSPRRKETATRKLDQAKSGTDTVVVRAKEGFWVAVLPFKYSGSNSDLTALSEGLTEEIVTGLSRFSYLKVIARSSTSRYANESVDVRSAGKQLGARYVMEGSLRQAGTKLRLAVQLVDAVSGAHLWAENYERDFSAEAVFEIQDDLVPRIVSTVADAYGVLPYSMSDIVRNKPPDQLTPYEAVLRALGYGFRINPEEHAAARTSLERAVQQAPAWAVLSLLYADEYGLEFGAQPDPLGRALQAARRATDTAPSNAFAQSALAKVLFFRKEFPEFRSAAEHAISLNPMDGAMLANLGASLAYSGDWERGCALVERAMQLNPRHPPWYWFPLSYNAYRKGDYRGSVNALLKVNLPGFFATHEVLAAAYGQLGEREAARQSLDELLKLVPGFGKVARALKSKWFDAEMVEHVLAGLQKAGLEIGDTADASPALKASETAAARPEEGFWVAVLPFKYSGSNSDLTALAEGLTDEIVTGLSRFSYLKVISRSSTSRYANESMDVRSAGKELGARYVMEGSLRQAGKKLRLAVRLVDANTGAHLWAENYERILNPETIFELQDDLVPRIVSSIADMNGVLPRSMSEAVRSRTPEELSPYEAVLRSFGYFERVTAEELAAARSGLELALQKAPAYADAWAMLALLCVQDHAQGFNLQTNPLTSGSSAARRAVEAAPSNHLAHFSLAQALFFQKEFQSFRNTAERAVTLNPMDGNSIAFLGELLTYAGDWERGMELAKRAKQLNPHHPGWYWYADFYNAYRQSDYRGAIDFVLKANLPGHWGTQAALAAAHGQLGENDAASKALRNLLKLRPDFAETTRTDVEKWWDPDYGRHLIDGLRKAGLEIGQA